jgi:hypothetical protein
VARAPGLRQNTLASSGAWMPYTSAICPRCIACLRGQSADGISSNSGMDVIVFLEQPARAQRAAAVSAVARHLEVLEVLGDSDEGDSSGGHNR